MTTSRRREPTVEVVGQDGLVLSVTPIDAPKPDGHGDEFERPLHELRAIR